MAESISPARPAAPARPFYRSSTFWIFVGLALGVVAGGMFPQHEYPQVYTEIEVVHEVTGAHISEAAIRRSIELSATKYCPVSAMLSAGATVIHHRYRIHSSGAAAYEAEGEVIATGPYARPDIE